MTEHFKIEAKSYEAVKLGAVLAVLATAGVEVKDELGIITVLKDGKKVATIDISTPLTKKE